MRSQFRNLVAVLFIGDVLLTQAAFYLSAVARQVIPLGRYIPSEVTFHNPVVHLIVALIWPVVFVSLDVYDIRRTGQLVGEARTLVTAILTAVFASAGALYFSFREVPRLLVVYFFLVDLFLLALFRLLLGLALKYRQSRGQNLIRVLVVGANEVGAAVAGALDSKLGQGFVWAGFADDSPNNTSLPILGTIDEVPAIVQKHAIDEIIIALPSAEYERTEALVHNLQPIPVRIRIVPDLFRLAMVQAQVESLSGIPLIGIREPLIEGASWAIKRTFDLVLSSAALLLLWPVMLTVAIGIKLDSAGPVIFKQQRVGENGRLFCMYKFRTMAAGSENQVPCAYVPAEDGEAKPVYKTRTDPRVTRLGHFLRRTSLDELPQLFNVLKGEMSLVGPRPEQAFIVEHYKPWQHQRLVVPPGITGWWQVSGRSELPMHLNTDYDLFYIRNYSVWLDLKILWRTIGAVIRGRGAF